MDAALAATLLKDLPTISDPITSAGWRAHLKRINLFFHIKGVADVPANNALKRTLLFYSLGNAGGQKAYHLSPDQRPAEETYANDLAELGKVFVPPQDSDMARSDYRKCKQAKNELFRPSTTRTHAYQINPQNIASHVDNYLEEYPFFFSAPADGTYLFGINIRQKCSVKHSNEWIYNPFTS